MTLPSIFDLCKPRDNVVKGTIADSDYAANLANVLTGRASRDYTDAPTFFTNSYPTEGLKELLSQCLRETFRTRRKRIGCFPSRYFLWRR